jgi:hypothetical protein
MSVPASKPIKAELGSALADLHTLAGMVLRRLGPA